MKYNLVVFQQKDNQTSFTNYLLQSYKTIKKDLLMAEQKTTEEGTQEKGKKKNLLLFIVIGVLVLLLIGGGLLAFFLLSGDDAPPQQMPPQQQQQGAGGGGGTATKSSLLTVGPMYPLDQFIVNLMTQGGKRYLKATITLELSDEAMVSEIEKKHAVIRDILIGAMSSKTVEEISTSRGKNKLKEELIARVNEVLTDGYVKNMFFTDFVIQQWQGLIQSLSQGLSAFQIDMEIELWSAF
eukprot:TRINITY_DN8602_c0_g2_i1.p3 TRINITY_DN8602_c0_g2~~TRINITY_DN8602_c0_g2_i1.p3  ORF type:complete len:239 (+),score=6.72 TRINITY_DN8602_c0_g2_i1:1872-2588(+)